MSIKSYPHVKLIDEIKNEHEEFELYEVDGVQISWDGLGLAWEGRQGLLTEKDASLKEKKAMWLVNTIIMSKIGADESDDPLDDYFKDPKNFGLTVEEARDAENGKLD